MANFATQHSAIEDDAKIPAELADGTKGHFTPLQLSTGSTIPGLARGNRTFIKALDTGVVTTAYLTEAGREGFFTWKSGNYAALVTADPQEGAYIKADAIATSSGAWVRDDMASLTIAAFGDITGSDCGPALQAMIDLLGYFRLPIGTFTIATPVVMKAGVYGAISLGYGQERSILNAVGMSGQKVISLPTGAYGRLTMRDFAIHGDADTALDLSVSSGLQLYQSRFEGLSLKSVAGPALLTNFMFSTHFERIDAWSTMGHAFDFAGGNTVTALNCYGHLCGDTSAAFRVRNGMTLIGCNSVDKVGTTHQCFKIGHPSGYASVILIGCNLEDFGDSGLCLDGLGGKITLIGCSFVAPASGTFYSYIRTAAGVGSNAWLLSINQSTTATSKGSTKTADSNITMYGWQHIFVESDALTGGGAGSFADAYNLSVSLLYPTSWENTNFPAYQKTARRFNGLAADEFWPTYTAPVIGTLTANSAAPTATGYNTWKTANTVATTVLTISGGVEGRTLTILVKDAHTTFKHLNGGGNQMRLSGAADYAAAAGDVLNFVYNATVGWIQI